LKVVVVNLENLIPKEESLIFENLNSTFIEFTSLLLLSHILTRKTKGKEPLVEYLHSHVVKCEIYLTILRQKPMDKEVVVKIKEHKTKDKEKKQSK
jgi:hypothetical protein